MAPSSRASIRLFTSVFVALCIASAVALPQRQHHAHRAVLPREPLPRPASSDIPVVLNSKPDAKTFLTQFFNFVLAALFGDFGSSTSDTTTTTTIVTATPIAASITSESGEITVVGLPVTTVLVSPSPVPIPDLSINLLPVSAAAVVSVSVSASAAASVGVANGFLLPIPTHRPVPLGTVLVAAEPASSIAESVLSQISALPSPSVNGTLSPNATTSEEIFTILPYIPSGIMHPPFANFSANGLGTAFAAAAVTGVLPTGTAISAVEANLTASIPLATGTGVQWPYNVTRIGGTGTVHFYHTSVPELSVPQLNTTTTIESIKTLLVTVVVSPVQVTGLAIDTGTAIGQLPLAVNTTARWLNTTFAGLPTGLIGTGTGLPSVPLSTPIGTGTAFSLAPIGTGTAFSLAPASVPFATGVPFSYAIPPILIPTGLSASVPPPAVTELSIPLPTPYINITSTVEYAASIPLSDLCTSTSAKTITLPLLNLFFGPSAYPSLNLFPGCIPPAINSSQALHAPGLLNCTELGREVQACQDLGKKVLLSVKGSGADAVGGNLDYGTPGTSDYPFGEYFPAPGEEGAVNISASTSATITVERSPLPNLFDPEHTPSGLALTLFSLFGEGHTERADLRPLGEDEGPIRWFAKPLGDEVQVDGFDVQVPSVWQGTYQGSQFGEFEERLRALEDESGSGDFGPDGKGIVLSGWV